MPKLSVFLITRDEERDLPACLESVRPCADEIVVVDDGSTDRTVEISRRFGARVVSRPMEGFGAQKQFALEQTTGDWALAIDADERLSPELAAEIRRRVGESEAAGGYSGFALRRHLFFLGRRLRFGGVGSDWVIRLVKRGCGRYREALIHERIEVNGRCGRLIHPMDHYSYSDLEEYLSKRSFYTNLSAEAAWRRGRRFRATDHLRPAWEMFVRVILRGAWLDGQPGMIYARLSAETAWLRAARLWELEQAAKRTAGQAARGSKSSPATGAPRGPRGADADPPPAEKDPRPGSRGPAPPSG